MCNHDSAHLESVNMHSFARPCCERPHPQQHGTKAHAGTWNAIIGPALCVATRIWHIRTRAGTKNPQTKGILTCTSGVPQPGLPLPEPVRDARPEVGDDACCSAAARPPGPPSADVSQERRTASWLDGGKPVSAECAE